MAGLRARTPGRVILAGSAGAVMIALYLVMPKAGILPSPAPRLLFQWDASNALGASAFQGGSSTAALGFLMHLGVSVLWAALYARAMALLPLIARHPIPSGLLFGAVVFCVMSFVLVPLGAARPPARTVPGVLNNLVAHVVFFGLPVSIVVSRGLRGLDRG